LPKKFSDKEKRDRAWRKKAATPGEGLERLRGAGPNHPRDTKVKVRDVGRDGTCTRPSREGDSELVGKASHVTSGGKGEKERASDASRFNVEARVGGHARMDRRCD